MVRELAGTCSWKSYFPELIELADAIDGAGPSAESARPFWEAFDELGNDADRKLLGRMVVPEPRDERPDTDP